MHKRFNIQNVLIVCELGDVIETTKKWGSENFADLFSSTSGGMCIIIKSKKGQFVYQEFETEFEKSEATFAIHSIVHPELSEDDDDADWWREES